MVDTDRKPPRPFDPAAKDVFVDIMDRLRSEVIDEKKDHWLWPDKWPERWGPKPEGYSVSRMGQRYGQFVLTGDKSHRQAQPSAHVLAYVHYNLKRDPTRNPALSPPGESGNVEWAISDISDLTDTSIYEGVKAWELSAKDIEDMVRRRPKRLHVRHDEGCPRFCVNPWHLHKGRDILNVLDREWAEHRDDPLPRGATNHRQAIIASYDTPAFNGIAERFKADGVKLWHIVKIIKEADLPWEWLFEDSHWIDGK